MEKKNMRKLTQSLISAVLCLAVILSILPIVTLNVSALSGDGSYYNPFKPTTYAEFKQAMEMPGEHFIVVDRMANTTGLSYIDISDEYTSGDCAINIPSGSVKDVAINCDLDIRTNSLKNFLYSFIGNQGELYLSGNGSLVVGMNAPSFPSAVVMNYKTLEVAGGISLRGEVAGAIHSGSFGKAIYNYDDATMIIAASSTGVFYGTNSPAVSNHSQKSGSLVKGGVFRSSTSISFLSSTDTVKIMGGDFNGIQAKDRNEQMTLKDILFSGYKIYTTDNKETIDDSLKYTEKSVYVWDSKKISNVELSCTEPKYGAAVSKITSQTTGVKVASYDWDTGSNYTQGRHVLKIRLEPQSGYSFSQGCKVTLNGDKLDITDLNHTPDGYITLECAYSVSDERPQLNAANFLVTGYEVGKNISDAKVASQSSAVTIRSYTWVDGANNEVSGTFGGQSYGVQIYFDVSDKYQCSNVDKKNITIQNISAYAIHYGGIDFDASLGDLMAVFYLNHLGNVLETVELSSNLAVDMPVSDITVTSNHRGIDLTTVGNVNRFAIYDNATGKQVTSGKIQDKPYEITVAFTCNSSYTADFDPKTDVTLNGMRPVSAKTSQGKYLVSFLFNAPQPAVTPTKLSPLSVYYHDGEGRKVQLLNATDSKREITVYLDELSKSVSGGLVHFVTYTDPLTEEEGHVTFSSSNTGIYDRFSYQKAGSDKADEVLVLFSKAGTTIIAAKLSNGETASVTVNVKASKGYTVSFDPGGGTGTMNPVALESSSYTLPANHFNPPAGKQFKAWKINGEEKQPGSKVTLTGNVTLTAVWEDMPEDSFTVKFDANDGTGTMRDQTQTGSNRFTLPQCTFTAPEGKMFDGWSYDGEKWQPGDKIGLQGDINTVKALWMDLPKDHICDTKKVDKVKPTETDPGKEAYYLCAGCGTAYEDKAAGKPIKDLESWGIIDPLGGQPTEEPSETTEPSEPTEASSSTEPSEPTEAAPAETNPVGGFSGGDDKQQDNSVPWWIIVMVAVLTSGIGVLIGLLIVKKKRGI